MSCCCSRSSAFNKFLGFRHSFQSKTFHWDVSRSILHPPAHCFSSRITGVHWFIPSFSAGFLHNSGSHVWQTRAKKVQIYCKNWTETQMWKRILYFCCISLFKCFITGPLCCVWSNEGGWDSSLADVIQQLGTKWLLLSPPQEIWKHNKARPRKHFSDSNKINPWNQRRSVTSACFYSHQTISEDLTGGDACLFWYKAASDQQHRLENTH